MGLQLYRSGKDKTSVPPQIFPVRLLLGLLEGCIMPKSPKGTSKNRHEHVRLQGAAGLRQLRVQ